MYILYIYIYLYFYLVLFIYIYYVIYIYFRLITPPPLHPVISISEIVVVLQEKLTQTCRAFLPFGEKSYYI